MRVSLRYKRRESKDASKLPTESVARGATCATAGQEILALLSTDVVAEHCRKAIQLELDRGLARLFVGATGLALHVVCLPAGSRAPSPHPHDLCPSAGQGALRSEKDLRRCWECVEHRWQVNVPGVSGRSFVGSCGRLTCWMAVWNRHCCASRVLIQAPEPLPPCGSNPAVSARSGGVAGAVTFDRAVSVLRMVVRELEAVLQLGELESVLDQSQRALRALRTEEARLRRAIRERLPELATEPRLPQNASRSCELVQRVRQYVRLHYHQPIGLGEAAASVHRTTAYVSTLFARETGMNFRAYLHDLRMNRARSLLRNPSILVSDVACAVGYASEDAFRHAFRKDTGFSPTEWRGTATEPEGSRH